MTKRQIAAAVISTDASFREAARTALTNPEGVFVLRLEIPAAATGIDESQLQQLRQVNPELVLLDLGDEPEVAVRFAQFLLEQNPARQVVAAGKKLDPELLLAGMRAGIAEFLPKPADVAAIDDVLGRLRRKRGMAAEPQREKEPGKVFAFFSPKGGSGATTLATNLAIHLHKLTGAKTLLLDLDLELGEIALFLGVQPRFNFVDMVRNFHRMDADLLASYIETHESGVHLLSAPYQPDKAEVVTGDQIKQILQFLRQHYDYVVMDTSKSVSAPTLAALQQADQMFIVSNVDLPSLRNIKRCLPLLSRINGMASDKIRLVVNRYNPRDEITLDDVQRTLGLEVYCTLSNDYESVIRAINTGRPIVLGGSSKYSDDLKRLTAKVAGLETRDAKGGLLEKGLRPFRQAFRRPGVGQPKAAESAG